MEFKAGQIAQMLGGIVEGNPDETVNSLSKIEEGVKGSLSFLANPAYTHYIYDSNASVIIVNKDFSPEKPVKSTLIRVDNAYAAFSRLLEMYNQIKLNKIGISSLAFISKTAVIGADAYIGEFAFIGENVKIGKGSKIYPNSYVGDNVTIGDDTTLFAGVKIYSDNVIGSHCTLHAGVVLGADGFGFSQDAGNNYSKVPQIGNVVIEDNVEIGANTTIDRATLGSTIIRKGCKIDNLIQIAHNVELGENTAIAAQAGIAGSAKIGKNCMIGGQVGIVGHITIADGVKIQAQSGINSSITEENAMVQGAPAFNIKDYLRSYVMFKNLPKLAAKIEMLEKELNQLKEK
jgi:UDP-3-O-[3-hydroxymyristoyl] glucosamine N-acyltransferase